MALQYREVTGYFTARIPDSGDVDLNPDTVPLTGNVTFHPEYRKPLVFPGEHIVLEPINAIIIDGQLMVEVVQDEDVVLQALHLPVTMDERANQTWSWTMRFHGMTLGQYGETVELPDARFVIEEGDGPLDLSTVPQTTGRGSNTFITRGDPGPGITGITASGGVVTVEWEGGDAVEIPIPTAALATPTSDGLMQAVDKAKLDGIATVPVRFDTTAGTAIYVSNGDRERRVSYDSGWRHVQHLLDTGDFELWGSQTPGALRYFKMQRVDDRVFLAGRIQPKASIVGTNRSVARPVFTGFPHGLSPLNTYQLVGDALMYSSGGRTSVRNNSDTLEMFSGTGTWQAGELIMITVDWSTFRILPNALPGTPD